MNLTIADGTYAALVTPRHKDGTLDVSALKEVVQFVMSHGITSVALNGATGEFCLTTVSELAQLLQGARLASPLSLKLLCGVGAASLMKAKELAAVAEAEGANGLLVPSPIYFRYSQEDLKTFIEELAASTRLPVLIYNLPQFSSGFAKETVASLIRDVPNVIGVKDSSGSLEILRHLTSEGISAKRFVGNDAVLAQALREDVCDGAVSGVACALPELVQELMNSFRSEKDLARYEAILQQCIDAIDILPTPWGIKWLLEARGITRAYFAQPVSLQRKQQAKALVEWFGQWFEAEGLGKREAPKLQG